MVTKETLTKYCDLVDYIKETEIRIKRLRTDIERINKRLNAIENGEKVSDKVYGGEGGWQGFIIEGIPVPEHEQYKTALLTKRLRLQDEHAVLAEHKAMLDSQKVEVQRFLMNVKDPHIKRIISFRCIDRMRWDEVARRMGGGNSEDSVKQAFWRYVSKEIL